MHWSTGLAVLYCTYRSEAGIGHLVVSPSSNADTVTDDADLDEASGARGGL